MAGHTPVPWLVHEWGKGCTIVEAQVRVTEKPGILMQGQRALAKELTRANAEFIVRACNAHDELLAALERLLEATGGCDFRDNANDEISGPCMGLADPMYGTECPECEARTVLAKAKEV